MISGRYQVYREYKESGVEWLGDVPKHWNLIPLKYLAKFSGGGTPSKDNPAFWNGNIPWVSPKDMKSRFVDQTIDNVTAKAVQQSSTNLLAEGALLLVVRSGILQHSIPAAINRVPVTLNQDMKALRFNEPMNAEFAQYFVQGNQQPLLLEWGKQGATVESIEQEYMGSSRTPCPPLTEQTQIAAFLDHETAKIDRLIEKQQGLIALLKEKRQAVISHAVTQGLNPHAPLKDSGIECLGQVPAHWKILRVKSVSTFLTSGPRGWSERVGDVGSLFIQSGDLNDLLEIKYASAKRVVVGNDAETSRTRLVDGDVVVCITGAKTGNVAVAESVPETTFINQHLCLVRPDTNISPAFLGSFLKGQIGQTYFELSQYGLKQGLSLEDVKEAPIMLPPIAEQTAIVEYLKNRTVKFDSIMQEALEAVTLLQERRTALISAAVTGKIDVRAWQPPVVSELETTEVVTG